MAHLTLDGATIPVTEFDESPVEIGTRRRAFDGSYLISRRATKRKWSGRTPWMLPTEAEMVRGIIQGAGQVWSLEQGTLYTTKGVPPVAGTGYDIKSYIGADNDPVINEYGDSPVKYGAYALSHDVATNLLPADTRDAEGTTSAYAVEVSATMAMDTTHYWQGAQSVKCTFNNLGTASAITTPASVVSGSNGTAYVGTIYVKADSPGTIVRLKIRDVTNATDGSIQTYTLTNAETWYRCLCFITLAGDSTDLRLYCMNYEGTGEIVYCDGWQIQESPVTGPWVDGTPASRSLYYDYSIIKPGADLTVAGWAYMPDQGAITTQRQILAMYRLANADCSISRKPGSSVGLSWRTRDPSLVNIHTLDYGTDAIWLSPRWNHFACVMSHVPDSGRYNKEIYFNGSLVAFANTTYIPDFVGADPGVVSIMFNGTGSSFPMIGTLDQFRILPYALNASAISALAASTVGVGETPIIVADGDGISTTSASVIGQVQRVDQIKLGTGYRKSVSFELHEV
jgi:hypothetical protein